MLVWIIVKGKNLVTVVTFIFYNFAFMLFLLSYSFNMLFYQIQLQ